MLNNYDLFFVAMECWGYSLLICYLSTLISILLYFPFQFCCKSTNPVMRLITYCFWFYIHGTPIISLLLTFYYIVFINTPIAPIWVAIIAFGVNGCPYVYDIISSGLKTVSLNEIESAKALGLRKTTIYCKIIIPKVLINILPIMRSQMIILMRLSAVAGCIGVFDLAKFFDFVYIQTFDTIAALFIIVVLYFISTQFLIESQMLLSHYLDPVRRRNEGSFI